VAEGEATGVATGTSDDLEDPWPTYRPLITGATLIVGTCVACFCTWQLLDSVEEMAHAGHMSTSFIGIIILPVAGYLAKCLALVASSRKPNQVNLAIRTAMSSILSSLLFLFPAMVLLGWAVGQPMNLDLDVFEAIVFFIAIVVLTCLVQFGRTNYFEGIMLVGTYFVIAAAFYIRPD